MALTTELRWDGKYDARGARVLPLRVKLPFQDVETVNESTLSRRTLFRAAAEDQPWRNRLIWGDKKYVLPSLLDEFAGKVNLIYIDPPFDTGADFSFTAAVPDAPEERRRRRHSPSPRSRASSSRRRTATPGERGSIRICNGFMRQWRCCMNCWQRTAAFMYIWTGTWVITPRSSWTRYLDQPTASMRSCGKIGSAHNDAGQGDVTTDASTMWFSSTLGQKSMRGTTSTTQSPPARPRSGIATSSTRQAWKIQQGGYRQDADGSRQRGQHPLCAGRE